MECSIELEYQTPEKVRRQLLINVAAGRETPVNEKLER
jgi:hypothetical protein